MTKEEAYERLEDNGTIVLSYDDEIECKEELIAIGVNLDLVGGCLRKIDYLSCSISYDNEYHLAEDLEREEEKLRNYLDEFGIDYELN
jgi:hypothetical protein